MKLTKSLRYTSILDKHTLVNIVCPYRQIVRISVDSRTKSIQIRRICNQHNIAKIEPNSHIRQKKPKQNYNVYIKPGLYVKQFILIYLKFKIQAHPTNIIGLMAVRKTHFIFQLQRSSLIEIGMSVIILIEEFYANIAPVVAQRNKM